jgi:protein-S-isoprenylcysteine O-methyltransferase Ste14
MANAEADRVAGAPKQAEDGLLLGRPLLLGYAALVGAAFAAFVQEYEQPALSRRYGAQYEAYRRAVPGWWPRFPPAHLLHRARKQ